MKRRIFLTATAVALASLGSTPAFSQSGEAAQVIFTNDKLTVIDAKGVEHTVKQGDFIQPGERVLTPPGVIGQIKLPDGTLLGARPGTDLKLEGMQRSAGKNVVVLNNGNVRVINVDPLKGPKPMPMDVVSPISTMHLTAGDGEAIHAKPGNKQNVEPGTYNRLQLGTAVVGNEKGEVPLPPMQPVFGAKLGAPLQPIAFLPTNLVKIEPILTTNTLISPTINLALIGDLKTISPTLSSSVVGPAPLAPLVSLNSPIKTSIGTANFTGASAPVISAALTPQYSVISPTLINTVSIKPPPLQPPPPPPKLIIKKFP